MMSAVRLNQVIWSAFATITKTPIWPIENLWNEKSSQVRTGLCSLYPEIKSDVECYNWMFEPAIEQAEYNEMPPGMRNVDEKPYASCEIIQKPKNWSEEAVRRINDKYDNYNCNYATSGSITGSDSASGSSIDTSDVSEEERLKIDICFRGLKTQVFVCGSLANLYYSDTSNESSWELRYTGVPVVLLDSGETRSRSKRRIQILLAERGTCFTLWQDTIDNLSAYKVAGHAFHTMFLSSDHRKIIGLSFDCPQAAEELWQHIERLTSCPENISLSVPGAKNKKVKKVQYPRLPEKSTISQPCCFQHVTSVDLNDKSRYFSMQTLLSVLPSAERPSNEL